MRLNTDAYQVCTVLAATPIILPFLLANWLKADCTAFDRGSFESGFMHNGLTLLLHRCRLKRMQNCRHCIVQLFRPLLPFTRMASKAIAYSLNLKAILAGHSLSAEIFLRATPVPHHTPRAANLPLHRMTPQPFPA